MEDFVTIEIAKKLKEKGFDYPCMGHYIDNNLHIAHYINAFHNDKDVSIDAPTILQVLKWLREKYIDIAVYPIFIYEPNLNRIYETEIHTPQLNKSVKLGYYRTWEEAITEGIYYAITKLKLNKI